jgi:predicted metal-dependent hydrolase
MLHTQHVRWIVPILALWGARGRPTVDWVSGVRVLDSGTLVAVECDPARVAVARSGDRLLLPLSPEIEGDALRAHVIAWLREAALACFEQRAGHYAPALAVPIPSIRLSNAKTRWGTCHPDGRVRLNWRLIQMPLALIDYVVVHELAHLRQPNHSPRFWREVERVLPDYSERRRALRRTGHHYLLT